MKFAADTKYLDVEGLPVTIGAGPAATPGMDCACWDREPPRRFDEMSAIRNGALISRDRWLGMLSPQQRVEAAAP